MRHFAQETENGSRREQEFEVFNLTFYVRRGLGVLRSYRAELTDDGMVIANRKEPCYETDMARAQEIVWRAQEAAIGCIAAGWGCGYDPEVVERNVLDILDDPPEEIEVDVFGASDVDSLRIEYFYRGGYDDITWRELAAIFADDDVARLWSRRGMRRAKK